MRNYLFREGVRKIFAAVRIEVPPSSGVVVVVSSLVEVGAVPSPGTVDSPGIVGVEPATAGFAVVAGMVVAVAADKALQYKI